MVDYNYPEQSIWPRPWGVTCRTQKWNVIPPASHAKIPQDQQIFPPLKEAHMFTLDGIDTHVTSHGLDQIDCLGEL